jgi:hypothetical protein
LGGKSETADGHSGRKRRTARASRPYHKTFSSVGAVAAATKQPPTKKASHGLKRINTDDRTRLFFAV